MVDDGSTDRTAELGRRFASRGVTVVSTENQGVSMAENCAFQLSQGEYIQYLDADDLLMPDKIERQLAALREGDSGRVLLSSQWAPFYYRTRHTRFVQNSLCRDLSPVEWLLGKMSENLHMQTSTWLVSRELIEAAGPWDTRLHYDHDGEYFCRVLSASEGTRFVPGTGVLYRMTGSNSVSKIGNSNQKRESLLLSIKSHIKCLRLLEDSERVRKACLTYMQNWYHNFHPGRPDLVEQLQALARELQGHLEEPRLRRKYAWMKPVFGWKAAEWAQMAFPQFKSSCIRQYDEAMYRLETARAGASRSVESA